jgi:uncharacterized protein (TIGR03435 family)
VRFVGSKGGPGTDDPSRYTCTYCGLDFLIEDAYYVPFYRLANANRLPDTRFYVVATIPEGATKEQFQRMLQSLLADRFKLAVHREKREIQTLRLLVAAGGPRLKVYVDGEPPLKDQPHRPPGIYYRVQGRTMAEFASVVAFYFAEPVVNATDLDGKYDFDIWFDTDLRDTNVPTLGAAIHSLGLKVESQKGPVEMIVADHVDKTPTAN